MPSNTSITHLIQQLKEGNRDAVQKLWKAYFQKLVCKTHNWLRSRRRQSVDAEDIALSAFDSFCRRAEQGRFPKLFDRDDLWKLLTLIAFRKMCNEIKHRIRKVKEINVSDLETNGDDESVEPIIEVISREPDPETVIEVADSCRHLLEMLPTAELQDIAVWKLEGYTNKEIAPKLKDGEGRSENAVERKLGLIRTIWAKEIPS